MNRLLRSLVFLFVLSLVAASAAVPVYSQNGDMNDVKDKMMTKGKEMAGMGPDVGYERVRPQEDAQPSACRARVSRSDGDQCRA